MNERIRELYIKTLSEECSNPALVDIEKFAELIVRECLKIVEPDQTSGDEWCVTLDETAQSIRQHFGIEQ
jgi:hypothetical protein